MRWMRRRQGTPKGTSTLEFLVVLPTLLLVMLGAIELSRAWMTMNVVTQAAREGARIGTVTSPFSAGPAIARINTILAGANLTGVAPTSVNCPAPCGPDSPVTATVTVTFTTLFPGMLPMLGPWTLTKTAVMRYE